MKGLFVVTKSGSLAAANGRTKEHLRVIGLSPGELVSAQVIEQRNPRLNALVNVVIAALAEAKGVTTESMRLWFKYRLGYVDLVKDRRGRVKPVPQSLSFDDMDEDRFREFWRHAETVIAGELLPELEPDEGFYVRRLMNGQV